jgi:hypothetical protein
VTPSGIEKGPKFTGDRAGTPSPTEDRGLERTEVNSGCNECNEALESARQALSAARRLAMVAMSAVMNGDSHRTRDALRQLQSVLTHDDGAPAESFCTDSRR